MSDGALLITGNSTYDVRVRAVRAVVEDGLSVTEVAQAYGADRSTLHRWLARFYGEGDEGLMRRPVPGRPRKMDAGDTGALKAIVMAPASKFGYETDFWTTRRLIQVVRSELGVIVSKQTMMRRLHDAGLTYQKPEREYFELSEEERAEWRRRELPKIRRAVRENQAILYFQDEANISLTALLARPGHHAARRQSSASPASAVEYRHCRRSPVVGNSSSGCMTSGLPRLKSSSFWGKCCGIIRGAISW